MADQVFDFLRVQAFRKGGVTGDIGEQGGNKLAFAGDLLPFPPRPFTVLKFKTAGTAEFVTREDGAAATGAVRLKIGAADAAKLLRLLIGALAARAIHGVAAQWRARVNKAASRNLPG